MILRPANLDEAFDDLNMSRKLFIIIIKGSKDLGNVFGILDFLNQVLCGALH